MKNKKEAKKYNQKLIVAIITVTLVLILGTSYAFFAFTLKAEKELSVVTGTFKIDYKDQNKIELENAYPMKDAKGMSLTPYEFTIENTGDLKALYDISLEIAENSNLDYNCLKYSIKRNDEEWSSPKRLTSLKLEEGIELDPTGKDHYQLRLWIDENVGNEAQGKTFIAKVIVNSVQRNKSTLDITSPVITLNGNMSENIEQGEVYTDPGVKSIQDDKTDMDTYDIKVRYEYFDGKTTSSVESIDTSKIGVYYIYYIATDKSGNEGKVVRCVNVYKKDSVPPVIILNGAKRVNVEKGNHYEELGATASKNGEDLTNRIVTVGTVNEKRTGTYPVKYLITDQKGNTASIVRMVYVVYINDGVVDDIAIDLSENPTEKINLTGENLGELTYQSSDESIASVDREGMVTGLAPGETTIHITSSTGIEKEIHVKVVKTVTVSYVKQGTGISIGKTSDTCEVTTSKGCEVVTPSISANTGYKAIGWNTDKDSHTGVEASTKITLQDDVTYYSISYKDAVVYHVNFDANGNTISKTEASCTIPEAYNGTIQDSSCSVVTPEITAPSTTPTVIGYNQTKTATTAQAESKNNLEVTSSVNGKTYYAITRKDAVTRSITYTKGTGVSSTGKSSDTCTIAAVYNGATQGTTCNVTLPSITVGTGYTSPAWYTSNAVSGTASSVNTAHTLSSNKTLYAVAKRNFTCASTGSTTTYAGRSWYTVANDGTNCTLALNTMSSVTGTYAEAATKVTSEYFTSGSTLLAEKNAGLTTVLGTYTAANGLSGSGIIWTSSSNATPINKTFPYYSNKNTNLNVGAIHTAYDTILMRAISATMFSGTYASLVTSYNTHSTSACSSVSGNNCVVNNGRINSTSVSNHGSTSFTSFYISDFPSSTSSFKIHHDNYPGNEYTFSQYRLDLVSCGGSKHGAMMYRMYFSSTSKMNHTNGNTGKVSTISNADLHLWQLAGVASSTTSTSGGKTYREYNPSKNASCVATYTYTYATATYPVQYRAYIRVKM